MSMVIKMIRKNRYTININFDDIHLHVVTTVMNFEDLGLRVANIVYTTCSENILINKRVIK